MLRYYWFWKKMNALPVHGGLLDQAAIFLESVEVIDRELSHSG